MKKTFNFCIAIIAFTSYSYAQSQPGGVSAGGTNQMWFDASALSLNNNDPVPSFTDNSGNGNHATQAVGSNQPKYKASDINMNNKPSVFFDGIDDILLTSSVASMNTSVQSVFVVSDIYNNNQSGMLFRGGYTSGAGSTIQSAYLWGNYNDATNYNFQIRKLDGTNIIQSFAKPSGRVFTEMIWNGSSSVDFYERGNLLGSSSGADANPTGNLGFSMGGNLHQPKPYFKGWIGEVIVYSTALNVAERRIIEAYLGAKYQLTVNNDLYVYDPTYSYDLIGLGQESGVNTTTAYGNGITISNPSTLGNGDYLLVAHDNAGYNANSIDVPSGSGSRYNQVWRVERIASPGSVTIEIDVSTNSLGTDNNLYELLVDADGTFSSGATSYAGTYSSGTVTFTNVSLPKGEYFTLYNSSADAIVSTGTTTDWHTTTTWDCSCIPTQASNVTILAAHTVDINGQDANASDLTIEGTLTMSSTDTLFFIGDFTNNGTFTAGTGTLYATGVIAQTISGSSSLSLNNLYNYGSVSLTNSTTITIANKLKTVDGVFNTGNDVTLLSDASGTANLSYPKFGNISGDLTLQRYLNEGESYYYLAPGVTDGNLEDWNQEFEMSGPIGSEWPGGPPSVYYYDQNNNVSDFNDGFTAAANTADVIDEKTGWYIYVGDDMYASGARTIDITGTPVLGNVGITLPHIANIGVEADDGWSLVSNPYFAPVRWVDVVKSGAFDEAQYKKADASNAVMDNTFILAPGESFWAHANTGGASLTFIRTQIDEDESDDYNLRVTNTYINKTPLLWISLDEGSIHDECSLGFNENATDAKEPMVDAYKLPHANPMATSISTSTGGNKLLRNVINSDVDAIIPINTLAGITQGNKREYSLKLTNVEEVLSYNKELILEDKELGTFTKLENDLELEFEMMDTESDVRFFLHVTTPLKFNKTDIFCYGAENGFAEASTKNAEVSTFTWKDENGNVLKQETAKSSKIENLLVGNYLLEVEDVKQKFVITQPEKNNLDFSVYYGGLNYGDFSTSRDENTFTVNVGEQLSFNLENEQDLDLVWDFGDLSGSTNRNTQHTYFNEGVYKVQLSEKDNNCITPTYKFVNVVDNNEDPTNLLFDFDVINIENGILVSLNNESLKNVSFRIHNSIGQEVFFKDVNANINHQERINLDNAQGVYMISVKDSNGTKTKKFVLSNK